MSGDKKQPFSDMSHSDKPSPPTRQFLPWIIGAFLLIAPILYVSTLARDLVYGDPTEYTFVANILGIAHPPGYAFYTLLGKSFQLLVPFGKIAWRMHLLSAVTATVAVIFGYSTVQVIIARTRNSSLSTPHLDKMVALFAALTIATAANWWQHAIHANPHIITATFLAANLFFLTKWWVTLTREQMSADNGTGNQDGLSNTTRSNSGKWLYVFCLTAGFGVTHHPLTVFSFLAYGAFILWVRPGIWRQWRILLKMAAFFFLGLAIWLYFPIRSAMQPAFGPSTMNTLDGFLDHTLGRGITESLPFFGLADQMDRLTVFWTLLRLQYSLPIIFLAALGLAWLTISPRRRSTNSLRPLALLFGLGLISNYLFVINLRQQDIMAYLLGIFLLIGVLSGIGLWGLLDLLQERISLDRKAIALLLGAIFLLGPVLQIVRNGSRISLGAYVEATLYTEAVFDWFDSQGEEAILLNDWEHMTPLWFAQFVEGRQPDPTDVQAHLVSTDLPWLESVFQYLPGGPVYLSGYRPEITSAGFRLRPRGSFYQVVQPGDQSIPPELALIEPASAGEIDILAYQLPSEATAGEYVPFTLAMSTPNGTADYYVPVLRVDRGDEVITFEFTTDSHQTTPTWEPGEVIVERFDFALPHDLPGGSYPATLGFRNLGTGEDTDLVLPLAELEVTGRNRPVGTDHLLANFRQVVGLVSAKARNGLELNRQAPWDDPIMARPGDVIHLTLEWESLAPAGESYTIFLHLIDPANRPLVTLDYTPLGGSTPTHLWIPKWLPGQRMLDPYRLEVPADLPPGEYLIEVGLYEMTGKRRLQLSNSDGNVAGDRYILGRIIVES